MASTAAHTLAAFLTPHTQWFNSQLELTVSSQEYLKELRILLGCMLFCWIFLFRSYVTQICSVWAHSLGQST